MRVACLQKYSTNDIELIERLAVIEARSSFWAYRQYMNPKMKLGWWQKAIAGHLQSFYDDLQAGKRPKLVIQAPPQHGKSFQIIDFISWLSGHNPDLRTIYTSFSERLGIRANLRLQRIYDGEKYKAVFPDTYLNTSNVVTISGQYLRNREILEYVGHDGCFRNTTVRGSITGEGLDLGVVDDPIKGREEANSETIREKTWDWFMDDFFTRFDERAGLLCILTRWHIDDPIGRLIEVSDDVKVVSYPAIAEADTALMPDDPRTPGSEEALFPEHKSKDFLLERRSKMTDTGWQSLYQQSPFVKGGNMFPVDRFVLVDYPPQEKHIEQSIRYWDKAGTDGGGCATAGVLMHKLKDGRFCISDVIRGQWAALERETRIKSAAESDGKRTTVWIEQEPGSGGKESAESTIRNLAGYKVHADKVSGDKVTRAEPYAAQVQGGNIMIVKGNWNRAFFDEHVPFPNGKYKDQVDAASGAFNKLNEAKKAGVLGGKR